MAAAASRARIGVIGYGTIGARVADAVRAQTDMELVGVAKTKADGPAQVAVLKGIPIFTAGDEKKAAKSFEAAHIKTAGMEEELLRQSDLVVDCVSDSVDIADRKRAYDAVGVPHVIFQGGEEHEDAGGFSFFPGVNHAAAQGLKMGRAVSCNTTGLLRSIFPLTQNWHVVRVTVDIERRMLDPADKNKAVLNADEMEGMPSHHGKDVKTVLPWLNIWTQAEKVPSTLMHVHNVHVEFAEYVTAEEILAVWGGYRRIALFPMEFGLTNTAAIMDIPRRLGRPGGDLYELAMMGLEVEGEAGRAGRYAHFVQAVHQEAIVLPENVDFIRHMADTEFASRSTYTTDQRLGIPLIRKAA